MKQPLTSGRGLIFKNISWQEGLSFGALRKMFTDAHMESNVHVRMWQCISLYYFILKFNFCHGACEQHEIISISWPLFLVCWKHNRELLIIDTTDDFYQSTSLLVFFKLSYETFTHKCLVQALGFIVPALHNCKINIFYYINKWCQSRFLL